MTPQEQDVLRRLSEECCAELTTHILPFWTALQDERGGFYGRVLPDLTIQKDAPKGTIQTARILWCFSRSAMALGDPALRKTAEHAYRFLRDSMLDSQHGGAFWSVSAEGEPEDDQKYTYCQSFVIYALCAYAELTNEQEPLELARNLFAITEEKAGTENGYREAFDRAWNPVPDDYLSEHDLGAERTMNTTLHLLEAYTDLYRLTGDAAVRKALWNTLTLMDTRIYDPSRQALRVFFNEQFEEIGDVHSFGHDIEACWLIDRACEVLNDPKTEPIQNWTLQVAAQVQQEAFESGALHNEFAEGTLDTRRIWWVQAEGVVGFLNAYARTENSAFHHTAAALWDYIKQYQLDKRPGGEWCAELDEQRHPLPDCDAAGPWKCPYHNGRMCLEVMKRSSVLCEQ